MHKFFKSRTNEELYTNLKEAYRTENNRSHTIRNIQVLIRLLALTPANKNKTLNEDVVDELIWDLAQRVGHLADVEADIHQEYINKGIVIAPLNDEFKNQLEARASRFAVRVR